MGTVSVMVVVVIVAAVSWWMRAPGERPGPRLGADLVPALLVRAGFPVTTHNVRALRERLGWEFLERARRGGDLTDHDAARLTTRCRRVHAELGRGDGPGPAAWPQRVLDEIAALDHRTALAVVHDVPATLLAEVGGGRGFLGGSVFSPLPGPAPAPAVASGPAAASVPAPRARPRVATVPAL